jgi:hypothetical protein
MRLRVPSFSKFKEQSSKFRGKFQRPNIKDQISKFKEQSSEAKSSSGLISSGLFIPSLNFAL